MALGSSCSGYGPLSVDEMRVCHTSDLDPKSYSWRASSTNNLLRIHTSFWFTAGLGPQLAPKIAPKVA